MTTIDISADGTRLHFDVVGAGDQPLLLLQDIRNPGQMLGPMIETLAADRPVIVVEPLGSADTDAVDTPYAAETSVRDACAILDAAGVECADVLGLWMGGCIAQELAIRQPDRVRSLALVSTLARPDAWFRRTVGTRRLLAERLGFAYQTDIALCLTFSPAAMREHADLIDAMADAAGPRESTPADPMIAVPSDAAYIRLLSYVLAHDALERLADVHVPALVIGGADDLLTTPLLTRELADALPNAEYRKIEGGTHALGFLEPQRVAELVREFLATRVTPAGG
jgi:pimeloyl-ACP methyl ester carboxylesterase